MTLGDHLAMPGALPSADESGVRDEGRLRLAIGLEDAQEEVPCSCPGRLADLGVEHGQAAAAGWVGVARPTSRTMTELSAMLRATAAISAT